MRLIFIFLDSINFKILSNVHQNLFIKYAITIAQHLLSPLLECIKQHTPNYSAY
jgi:hypothetical protein